MTERERLIRLICEGMAGRCGIDCSLPQNQYCDKVRATADYLLDNGVIVPHCKIGDTVYALSYYGIFKYGRCVPYIDECKVVEIVKKSHDMYIYAVGDSVHSFDDSHCNQWGKIAFLTKEEAEKALKAREK